MKKIVILILTAALLLALVPAAYAAGSGRNSVCTYADADRDGICDNRSENCADQNGICDNRIDEDKDGVCDNRVDENNDGLCDNRREQKNACNDRESRHGQASHHGGQRRGCHR